MSAFELLTFNPSKRYDGSLFYELNKGMNSGKPLDQPCPNCFVCLCADGEARQFLYWLFMLLWKAGYGREILVGSVIPFVRKQELMKAVYRLMDGLESKEQFDEVLRKLEAIELYEKRQKALLHRVQDLKVGLLRGLVK